ncbi:MAG: hypothetical protein AAFR95_13950 [Bacteroidota bacterium]
MRNDLMNVIFFAVGTVAASILLSYLQPTHGLGLSAGIAIITIVFISYVARSLGNKILMGYWRYRMLVSPLYPLEGSYHIGYEGNHQTIVRSLVVVYFVPENASYAVSGKGFDDDGVVVAEWDSTDVNYDPVNNRLTYFYDATISGETTSGAAWIRFYYSHSDNSWSRGRGSYMDLDTPHKGTMWLRRDDGESYPLDLPDTSSRPSGEDEDDESETGSLGKAS